MSSRYPFENNTTMYKTFHIIFFFLSVRDPVDYDDVLKQVFEIDPVCSSYL